MSSSDPTHAAPASAPQLQTPPVLSLDGETSDSELVLRCQQGDMHAFDELVTRYRGRIYAMTYNLLQNDADAMDRSQEIFIKAWKALPKFEARSGFFTWLYRIAHNVCYDHLRTKKYETAGEFDDSMEVASPDPAAVTIPHQAELPDRNLTNAEIKKAVMAAIDQLSPDHKSVILLKEIDDLSYKEIADITGCSMGTVMSRLFYARKKLQSLLGDVYNTYLQN